MLDSGMESTKGVAGDGDQVLVKSSAQDVAIPQRSITDFFKSPPKGVGVAKHSTLLGYFPSQGKAQENLPVQDACKLASKKRKRSSVDESSRSFVDLDSAPAEQKENKSKKVKSAESVKKKKAKSQNNCVVASSPETSDCQSGKENEDMRCDQAKPPTLKSKLSRKKSKKSKQVSQIDNSSCVIASSCTTSAEISISVDSCKQRKETSDESEVGDLPGSSDQSVLTTGNGGTVAVEVSYEDFLQSEGVSVSAGDTDAVIADDDKPPVLPMPKCHKLLDYFHRKENGPLTTNTGAALLDNKSDSDIQIVTKAVIHSEPSPPSSQNPVLVRLDSDPTDIPTSHILLSDDDCGMEIAEISSEIILLTPAKPKPQEQEIGSALPVNKNRIDLTSPPGNTSEHVQTSSAQKNTQSTLCFTKKGLSATKKKASFPIPTDTQNEAEGACDIVKDKGKQEIEVKKAKGSKKAPKKTTSDKSECPVTKKLPAKKKGGSTGQVSAPSTPVQSRRSPRLKALPSRTPDLIGSEAKKRVKKSKQILRQRHYKVAHLEAGGDNHSPIRIRLRRCSKGNEENCSVNSSVPVKKVQDKKNGLKKKSGKKSKQPEKCPIDKNPERSCTDNKNKSVGIKKTKSMLRDSPTKKTMNSTKSKTPKKLAPIFSKKTDTEVAKSKPDIDPEKLRQKQEFLKSSIPAELRQRGVTSEQESIQQLAPIPRVSHVQQKQEGSGVWNLPSVDLKLKRDQPSEVPSYQSEGNCGQLNHSKLAKSPCGVGKLQDYIPELKDDAVGALLAEIQRNNPTFPVHRLYNCFKAKKEASQKEFLFEDASAISVGSAGEKELVEILDSPPATNPIQHAEKQSRLKTGATKENKSDPPRRNRLRRSHRSKERVEEVLDEEKPAAEVEKLETDGARISATPEMYRKGSDQLWTDRYQPSQSLELIGNGGSVRKLKSWLQKWKERCDKEAKMLKKLLRKQQKTLGKATDSENSRDWWTDDESDFEGTRDDSDWTEEDCLMNTVLISGPHGIGKSAAVYAVAQELGYQVFEVNATSSRSGKRILGKLQEATQSHQVAKQTGGIQTASPSTPSKSQPPVVRAASPCTQKGKMPTAFTNLFKKTTQHAEKQPVVSVVEEKQGKSAGTKRKRSTGKEEKACTSPKKKVKKTATSAVVAAPLIVSGESNSSASLTTKGLNLAANSLILFDEVDVVFEEDKGFWAAIQSFMNISKRPIILTCTDAGFSQKFEGQYDQLQFKRPPYMNTVTYLQLLCLVENVRVDFSELVNLVQLYKADVRRCVLALQYWVESGGGRRQELTPVVSPDRSLPTEGLVSGYQFEDTLSQSQDSNCGCDTPIVDRKQPGSGEFEMSGSSRNVKSRRRIVLDESSGESCSPQKPVNTRRMNSIPEVCDENAMFTNLSEMPAAVSYPVTIHKAMVESLLGVSAYTNDSIQEALQTGYSTIASSVTGLFGDLKQNLINSNLEMLLPIPVEVLGIADSWPVKSESELNSVNCGETRTRIKVAPESCTSDSSDSEWVFEKHKAAEKEPVQTPVWNSLRDKLCKSLSGENRQCLSQSLQSLANFYESCSDVDTLHCRNSSATCRFTDVWVGDRGNITPGLTDELSAKSKTSGAESSLLAEIGADISARSLRLCRETLSKTQQAVVDEGNFVDSYLKIPVLRAYQQPRLVDEMPLRSVTVSSRRKAYESVVAALPLHTWTQCRRTALDYSPMLRSVCRAEQIRQIAKTKRRFLHYLDAVSLNLKESTVNVLASSFT